MDFSVSAGLVEVNIHSGGMVNFTFHFKKERKICYSIKVLLGGQAFISLLINLGVLL